MKSFFILDKLGEIIIERHFLGNVSRSVAEEFYTEIMKEQHKGGISNVSPIISTQKYYVAHVFRHSLYFVGVVDREFQPLMIIEMLHRIVDTLEIYIEKVNEQNIKNNFVVVYQLLDEMIDGGFPITTEIALLKDLVRQPASIAKQLTGDIGKTTVGIVGHNKSIVPWRKAGIKYMNNEVYFDIVETLNVIVDVNGGSAVSEVFGVIKSSCKLSGTPDLLFNFNDPNIIEDISFHPCVRYARYEQDKSISFIPPDGDFELLSYRMSNLPMLPIYCRPQITFYRGGANVNVMLNLRHTHNKSLDNVRVIIPIPTIDNQQLTTTVGSISYESSIKSLVWNVGKLSPQTQQSKSPTPSLSGKITFPLMSGKSEHEILACPAVQVQFELDGVSMSGLKVESVQLRNENYKPFKGVRYVTTSGRYEVRTV
ncbi:predicted protein [Naegleria gruberi]|uniref:Predicted protein n=1 Tax=Naegleria gruberi TaxID=5762 RepID=D2V3X3_NAEGR|nr:uncharacterized protein NAEGRDRAFT_30934 [Naegleria gruberi]EFC48275.1 predicted protein [Naegleria gruberi]|eukprot:XP_002681019.1 predicted protein [Naegleria gruberi strain NEG-M]